MPIPCIHTPGRSLGEIDRADGSTHQLSRCAECDAGLILAEGSTVWRTFDDQARRLRTRAATASLI